MIYFIWYFRLIIEQIVTVSWVTAKITFLCYYPHDKYTVVVKLLIFNKSQNFVYGPIFVSAVSPISRSSYI